VSWRAVTIAVPIAYLAAFVAVTAIWGLPLAHDQLFLWILGGLAAVSLRAWRRWGVLLLEWLPILALLVVYDYVRGAVTVPGMEAHVWPQVDFDRWLTGGAVPTVWLQQHLYDPGHLHWYDVGIWCVYLTHFFTVWVVAAVLWKVAHDRFRSYAALAVTLTLMAFLTYWLYPAQPPWMAAQYGEIGAVDKIVPTVWGHLGVPVAQNLFQGGEGLVNLVAAMPSLHAAYPAMMLLFFWRDGVWWRVGLGLYTLAMGFTLVYGGEHFVADVVVGWLWAAIAYVVVCVAVPAAWARRRARSAAAVGDPEPGGAQRRGDDAGREPAPVVLGLGDEAR
jgi:membrane-associated phospholipid phosphatase